VPTQSGRWPAALDGRASVSFLPWASKTASGQEDEAVGRRTQSAAARKAARTDMGRGRAERGRGRQVDPTPTNADERRTAASSTSSLPRLPRSCSGRSACSKRPPGCLSGCRSRSRRRIPAAPPAHVPAAGPPSHAAIPAAKVARPDGSANAGTDTILRKPSVTRRKANTCSLCTNPRLKIRTTDVSHQK
jgi:hypothetical protein